MRYAHGGAFRSPHLTGQSEQAWCLTLLTNAVETDGAVTNPCDHTATSRT
ncbi:hypothetical protein [Nonomuraea guangzhouensis]|uniref:Uncharacterized protein n=1 Tax=Nonomuraea guangzhouensis TaxID=1291555 RepID=A0ABW4GJ68_9ACTN